MKTKMFSFTTLILATVAFIGATNPNLLNAQTSTVSISNNNVVNIGKSNSTLLFNNDVFKIGSDRMVRLLSPFPPNGGLPKYLQTKLGFGGSANSNPDYQIGHYAYYFMTNPPGGYYGLYFGGYNNSTTLATYMFLNSGGLSIGRGMSNARFKLDVQGTVGVDGVQIHSDKRYKKDIKPLAEDFDKLLKLNSVTYKRSSDVLKNQLEDLKNNQEKYSENKEFYETQILSFESQIEEAEKDTVTKFGFIAQELKEIYPELVHEDNEGYLSVNYIGLIPVLVETIKGLNERIETLEGKGFEKSSTVVLSSAKLYQNNPNPFSENTEIKYYVPESSNSAMICIYDLVGSQIMKFENLNKGYSSLTVRGSELKAGMYIYALLVDGKEIDTKRMILTDK